MKLAFLVLALFCTASGAEPPARSDAAKPGTGTHFLYLVRHGIYDRDESATDDRTKNGINAKGRKQARLVGERVAKLPVHFDRLISSELLRAKDTADEMAKVMHMTPTRDGVLNECSPTALDMGPMSAKEAKRTAECDAARVQEWERYFVATPERDTYDVLVAHGNITRWTLLRALGADTRTWKQLDSANASLTIIAIGPDGVPSVVMYDDVGHLPVELQTWSGRAGGWGVGK